MNSSDTKVLLNGFKSKTTMMSAHIRGAEFLIRTQETIVCQFMKFSKQIMKTLIRLRNYEKTTM